MSTTRYTVERLVMVASIESLVEVLAKVTPIPVLACYEITVHIGLQRGFSDDKLGVVFSNAALANSLIAIGSGYVAQAAADFYGFV